MLLSSTVPLLRLTFEQGTGGHGAESSAVAAQLPWVTCFPRGASPPRRHRPRVKKSLGDAQAVTASVLQLPQSASCWNTDDCASFQVCHTLFCRSENQAIICTKRTRLSSSACRSELHWLFWVLSPVCAEMRTPARASSRGSPDSVSYFSWL